jgi:hypothetical protein
MARRREAELVTAEALATICVGGKVMVRALAPSPPSEASRNPDAAPSLASCRSAPLRTDFAKERGRRSGWWNLAFSLDLTGISAPLTPRSTRGNHVGWRSRRHAMPSPISDRFHGESNVMLHSPDG